MRAGAAYNASVFWARKGRFPQALEWARKAAALDPNHEMAAKQVEGLGKLLAALEERQAGASALGGSDGE